MEARLSVVPNIFSELLRRVRLPTALAGGARQVAFVGCPLDISRLCRTALHHKAVVVVTDVELQAAFAFEDRAVLQGTLIPLQLAKFILIEKVEVE